MSYSKTIGAVRETLTTTFSALDSWFDKPEQVRNYRPADNDWTIEEILEHTTLTSHFLLIVIRNGAEKSLKRAQKQNADVIGNQEAESDLTALAPIGHPDTFPWLRPEHMEPTRSKISAEVRLIMQSQLRECLEILEQLRNGEGVLHKVRMSVQDLGKLDMYQWLYFLALHAQRHLAEIERLYSRIPAC